MPIAILEIPRSGLIDTAKAKELCENAGDRLHDILDVPDPGDKESRVTRGISDKIILRMSFTIGPSEYPDFEPGSFFPTTEQIESAGQSVLGLVKDSSLGVSQVVIEAWKDTTFLLREGETPKTVSPTTEEKLREIGSHLDKPRIRLILSSLYQEGVSIPKELGQVPENESQRVTLELGKRIAEIFGYKEPITAELEFAQEADTDVSVEFDCEIKPDTSLPEEVRKYMAESVLHILDSNQLTKEGSAEVWIRQGQPDTKVFNVV